MQIMVVPLTGEHLDALPLPAGLDRRAYFTPGSMSCCILADGEPVFAGGIVNMDWKRGEAWIIPTPFFRDNLLICWREMRTVLPYLAEGWKFRRVQATCLKGASASLFRNLGFKFEGTLSSFGPNGEECDMYSRVFEVTP